MRLRKLNLLLLVAYWLMSTLAFACHASAGVTNRLYVEPFATKAGASFQNFAQDRDCASKAPLFNEGVLPNPFQEFLFLNYTPGILNKQQQNVGGFRGKRDSV
jgi:hypothetical protein